MYLIQISARKWDNLETASANGFIRNQHSCLMGELVRSLKLNRQQDDLFRQGGTEVAPILRAKKLVIDQAYS